MIIDMYEKIIKEFGDTVSVETREDLERVIKFCFTMGYDYGYDAGYSDGIDLAESILKERSRR